MATNKFAVYTERDLITIVDGLSNETLKFTIPELKELQSELINRRIDGQQVSVVSNLIMKQMATASESEPPKKKLTKRGAALEQAEKENIFLKEMEPEEKKPEAEPESAQKGKEPVKADKKDSKPPKKEKFAEIEDEEYEDDYYDEEDERFPILGFLTAFYKIVGWLGVIAIIGGGVITSCMMEYTKAITIMITAGCIVIAALFLLIMSAKSESIALSLEKEKHLRRIRDLLRKNA